MIVLPKDPNLREYQRKGRTFKCPDGYGDVTVKHCCCVTIVGDLYSQLD